MATSIIRLVDYWNHIDSDWYSIKHFAKHEIVQFVFATIISVPFIFLKRHHKYYQFLLAPLWVLLGVILLHVIVFLGYPNSASFFTVISTNSSESISFITDYFTIKIGFIVFGYWLAILGVNSLLKKVSRLFSFHFKIIYFSMVTIGLCTYFFAKQSKRLDPIEFSDVAVVKLYEDYCNYKKEQKEFESILKQKIEFEGVVRKQEHNTEETHIIIIGESTSKHHMSLYGYQRETNPLLQQQKILKFESAISPNAHTVPALEKVLTYKNERHADLGIAKGSIIDLLNQVGYETYWISNQAYAGANETPISVMAAKANHKIFTNPVGHNKKHDETLLPEVSKALKSKNSKVIFVHLMGTHLSYKERYPNGFKHFRTITI